MNEVRKSHDRAAPSAAIGPPFTWWQLLHRAVGLVDRHKNVTPQLRDDLVLARELLDDWICQIDARVTKHGW